MKQLDYKKINHYIKQIASGNVKAFDKLFEYTYRNMEYIARYYLQNDNNVEDVLIELYKKVLEKASCFDCNKNGYNWLYTIAKNLALDENRRQNKFYFLNDSEVEDKSFQPLNTLIVQEAMTVLDDKEKQLLYYIFWEGYTIKEIAEKQKVPIATIYTQRSRIYKKMKKFLKN